MTELMRIAKHFNIKSIESDRKYWLFRVEDICSFKEFYDNQYIALDSSSIFERGNEYLDVFINSMKENDIVVAVDSESSEIIIGEILDKESIETEDLRKYRRMKWLKNISIDSLDIYLHKLLNTNRKIVNADEYSRYIDRSIYDFYIKDNNAHILFEVKAKKNISAINLLKFIASVVSIVDIYNEIFEDNLDKSKIELQINVQSPGPIEFFGDIEVVLLVGIILVIIVGGRIKFEKSTNKSSGEIETEGLLEKIMKFYKLVKNNELDSDKKKWKKTLEESIDALELKKPETLFEEEKEK